MFPVTGGTWAWSKSLRNLRASRLARVRQKKLLLEAKVCVSPGVGFGEYGDDHVRFALIENQDRIRQAVRGIRSMFRADGLVAQKS
jgi:bifunctional pyridoxal-dependent enzyme with beta-cystathionase and maltose regulon repressor activities